MNQLTKGKIRSGRRATEPVQVLRPADPPVQSLPSGLKQQINSQKPCDTFLSEKEKLFRQLQFKRCRWETLLQSTTATIVELSGSLATVDPGQPSDRGSGLQLLMNDICWTSSCSTRYVGYGPTKNYAVRALRRKRCPVKCRPEAHKDWEYCWTNWTNPRLTLENTSLWSAS